MKRSTTVDVSVSTLDSLKNLKKKYPETGRRSIDGVIRWLLKESQGKEEEPELEVDEHDDVPDQKKKRKINVADPLYTFEILEERPKFLEYLTSFTAHEIKLLIRRFKEVFFSPARFRFCAGRPRGCAWFVF